MEIALPASEEYFAQGGTTDPLLIESTAMLGLQNAFQKFSYTSPDECLGVLDEFVSFYKSYSNHRDLDPKFTSKARWNAKYRSLMRQTAMSILYHHMKLDENFLLDTEADMVVPNDFNYSTYKLDIDHVYDMKDRISDTNTFDVLSAEKNSFEKDRQTFLRIQMDNSSTISRASIFNVLNDFDVNYNNEHILEDINAFVREVSASVLPTPFLAREDVGGLLSGLTFDEVYNQLLYPDDEDDDEVAREDTSVHSIRSVHSKHSHRSLSQSHVEDRDRDNTDSAEAEMLTQAQHSEGQDHNNHNGEYADNDNDNDYPNYPDERAVNEDEQEEEDWEVGIEEVVILKKKGNGNGNGNGNGKQNQKQTQPRGRGRPPKSKQPLELDDIRDDSSTSSTENESEEVEDLNRKLSTQSKPSSSVGVGKPKSKSSASPKGHTKGKTEAQRLMISMGGQGVGDAPTRGTRSSRNLEDKDMKDLSLKSPKKVAPASSGGRVLRGGKRMRSPVKPSTSTTTTITSTSTSASSPAGTASSADDNGISNPNRNRNPKKTISIPLKDKKGKNSMLTAQQKEMEEVEGEEGQSTESEEEEEGLPSRAKKPKPRHDVEGRPNGRESSSSSANQDKNNGSSSTSANGNGNGSASKGNHQSSSTSSSSSQKKTILPSKVDFDSDIDSDDDSLFNADEERQIDNMQKKTRRESLIIKHTSSGGGGSGSKGKSSNKSSRARVRARGAEKVSGDGTTRVVNNAGTRKRVKFTLEEELAIVNGVSRYATNWASILADPEFREILARRTQSDIKDKFRNLAKSGKAPPAQP